MNKFICLPSILLYIMIMLPAHAQFTQPMERKLRIMLMEYEMRKDNGIVEEEKARLKFMDKFEDLWSAAGMKVSPPFREIESVLLQNPKVPPQLSEDDFIGTIRISSVKGDIKKCTEYQNGLWLRNLPPNHCH